MCVTVGPFSSLASRCAEPLPPLRPSRCWASSPLPLRLPTWPGHSGTPSKAAARLARAESALARAEAGVAASRPGSTRPGPSWARWRAGSGPSPSGAIWTRASRSRSGSARPTWARPRATRPCCGSRWPGRSTPSTSTAPPTRTFDVTTAALASVGRSNRAAPSTSCGSRRPRAEAEVSRLAQAARGRGGPQEGGGRGGRGPQRGPARGRVRGARRPEQLCRHRRLGLPGAGPALVHQRLGPARAPAVARHKGTDILAPRGTPVVANVAGSGRPQHSSLGRALLLPAGQRRQHLLRRPPRLATRRQRARRRRAR